MAHVDDRRSFLRWATHGLSAVFGAIVGVPALAYLTDPCRRRSASTERRLVEGIRLSEIQRDTAPVQGVIRDVRVDGWTLHPNDVVGRVWVVADPNSPRQYRVFTTICPHLGCSVNLSDDCFACPCHNARFQKMTGERILQPGSDNPAPRGMDELEWERDSADSDRIRVRYENFKASVEEKVPIG